MKLLVLDVEGTLFQTKIRLAGTSLDSTIWQSIADALGPIAVRDEVETHRCWERGEYSSYLEWMEATIAVHARHGLTRSTFDSVLASAEYNDSVVETLRSLNRDAYRPVMVTGGFRELARRAQVDMDIHHAFAACEYLFGADGRIAGWNLLPCDFEGKIDFIRLMLREYKIADGDWVFVGDGKNDVPLAQAAPVAIALNGHPDLREVADYTINQFSDISEILTDFSSLASGRSKR